MADAECIATTCRFEHQMRANLSYPITLGQSLTLPWSAALLAVSTSSSGKTKRPPEGVVDKEMAFWCRYKIPDVVASGEPAPTLFLYDSTIQ